MSTTAKLTTVYRVKRYHGRKLVRDYGEFDLEWVAAKVARAASEKHVADVVGVFPTPKRAA